MKKVFLLILLCGAYTSMFAQNSFPATGNVLINTSTDNGYQLQVNGGIKTTGARSILGNIAFLTGGTAVQAGLGAGIFCAGINGHNPVIFQGPTGGYAVHGFIFQDMYGGIAGKAYYQNGSYVNIHNSFAGPNQNGLSVAGLLLDGEYNNTTGMSSTIRGIYYNPTLTSVNGTHIAIETVTGTNIFGSTSGNTLIGTSTDNGNKFQVTGSSSFNGSVRFQTLTNNNTYNKALVTDDNGNIFYRDISTLQGTGGWSIGGNIGSNPASNFIGTTDNQPIAFRTNNSEKMRIDATGNVGIGTTSPTEMLSVNGNIRTRKVIVTTNGWADYVFEPTYKLPSLDSIAAFIKVNKHLPEIPSASAIEKDGQDVGEIQKLLLKKMEEMTLYMIELKAENNKLKEEIEILKNK